MMNAKRVPRHSWLSCALVTLVACGGLQKVASPVGSPTASYQPASSGGYVATIAEQRHVAVDRRGGGYLADPIPERPGLGTTWGEPVSAPISFAPFVRSTPAPWAEVAIHYSDADGIEAHAEYLRSHPTPLEVYAGDGSVSVALVDEAGRTLPGYTANGRALVVGEDGARYQIVVRNGTTARFEVVASVDGLDVVDGQLADPNRRGYIVDPHDVLVINGFRTSNDAVAAFRFGKVAESYAAQTSGDRNVGIIGLAIFSERGAVWTPAELDRRDTADPFPQRGYAMPPR